MFLIFLKLIVFSTLSEDIPLPRLKIKGKGSHDGNTDASAEKTLTMLCSISLLELITTSSEWPFLCVASMTNWCRPYEDSSSLNWIDNLALVLSKCKFISPQMRILSNFIKILLINISNSAKKSEIFPVL